MTYNTITAQKIIYIHNVIEEKYNLPAGHVKKGELETLVAKSECTPFSDEIFSLFKQAAIIFEGLVRLHIFTDGNKRTALETTRVFLNKNNRNCLGF